MLHVLCVLVVLVPLSLCSRHIVLRLQWLRLLPNKASASDTAATVASNTILLPDDNQRYLLLKGDIEERPVAPESRTRAFANAYELNEMEFVSHLRIERALTADAGRYLCVANLHTGYSAYVSKSAELFVRPGAALLTYLILPFFSTGTAISIAIAIDISNEQLQQV